MKQPPRATPFISRGRKASARSARNEGLWGLRKNRRSTRKYGVGGTRAEVVPCTIHLAWKKSGGKPPHSIKAAATKDRKDVTD